MERVYLTKAGYEKLADELEYRKNAKRKEIAKALEHARLIGDLRENAEYTAAKEALVQNEERILELEDKLARAEIIDDSCIAPDAVCLGAKVRVKDMDSGQEFEYTIVSSDEANPNQGFISASSPVGEALLGKKENDSVAIHIPSGILKYRILKVSR